jgi:hypothetical protein
MNTMNNTNTSSADEQRVQLGFGKVNLKTMLATFATLRLRAPFQRDSAVSCGKRDAGTLMSFPVSAHPAVNGCMYRDYATHPNGTIIMLQASWKRGGSATRDGCVLLRLRADAALLNVIATLPHGPDSLIGDAFAVFQGCADILSAEEAAVHKIVIPPRFIDQFFDPVEVDECFRLEEIRPERAARPSVALVATPNGVVMQETASAPTRRMRFRKTNGPAGGTA